MKCHSCSEHIDPEHDKYYYCECGAKICFQCHLSLHKCSECGRGLQFHDESITKKVFNNPATRNGLGF